MIANCQVSLAPGGKSSVTGSDGVFEFGELEPGTYTVSFSKAGYEEASKTVSVTSGETSSINITLKAKSAFAVSSNKLDFGDLSSTQELYFYNNSDETASFSMSNIPSWASFSQTSGTVSAGGNNYLVDCYCALNELTKNGDYGSFGTICHEYTHCFGFPDFYYSGGKTVNDWDLMDYGNYNGDGYLPPGYSAHERWLMGWLIPIVLDETTTITDMPALAEEGRAYLIRNDGCENEYYIVENRQPMGWDAGLPSSGILVFHIEFDPSIWTSTKVAPNSSSRKRYELFHANNKTSAYQRADWPYPYQENNSLTNTSSPAATLNNENLDGTKLMSKPITNMAVNNGLASFDFTVTTTGLCSQPSSLGLRPTVLYRFGPIDVVRTADGKIQKVVRRPLD